MAGDLEQLLLRTGIGYNLTENNNNLLAGYGYILSENCIGDTDQKNTINEHRLYQQFISKQNIGSVIVQHRYRLEQRFIENDFKMQLRYFLSLNVPLNNKELIVRTFYVSAYNKVFLNTQETIFDRIRLYAGLGYKVNDSLRLELSYMNQTFNNGTSRDQLNVITFYNF